MAVFALVFQPVSGFLSGQLASAADSSSVCATGCDYTSIQSAINAAADGDTITVLAGTYAENLTIDKQLHLIGNGAVINSAGGQNTLQLTTGASDTTIEGFTIYTNGTAKSHGIDVPTSVGLQNITIHNNIFSAKDGTGALLYLESFNNSLVTGNIFNVSTSQASVMIDDATATNNTWSNNVFQGATNQLAFGTSGSNVTFTDNDFTNLTVSGKDKIVEFLGVNATASGNTFNPAQPAISVYGTAGAKGTFTTFDKVSSVLAAGDRVVLESDIVSTKQFTIAVPGVTLNGNGHTIDGQFVKTDNNNNAVVGIQADNVTVTNLAVTSSADLAWPQQLHGINVDSSAGVSLEYITATNLEGSGILVNNGSTANVVNVTTGNNGWHGINVDNGATLNISGTSTHNENSPNPISDFVDRESVPDIFIDDNTKGSVVNDVDGQYISGEVGFRGNTAIVYTLGSIDTTAPSVPGATLKDNDGKLISNDGFIGTDSNKFTFDLSSTDNVAVTNFKLKYWNDITGDKYEGESKAWNHQVGADGVYADKFSRGEGVHHFSFSACDAAGNCSAYSEVFTVTYDNTNPAASITTATQTSKDVVTLTNGKVSDTNLNYYYCWLTTNSTVVVDGYTYTPGQEVKLDGDKTSTRDANCETTWAKGKTLFEGQLGGFNVKNFPSGEYTVNLIAVDKAGNKSDAATSLVTIDHTAPTATLKASNLTPSLDNVVVVEGSVTDNDIKSHWFEIKTPAGVYYKYNMNTTDKSMSFILDTDYGAGEYVVRYVATDRVGNRNDSVYPSVLTLNITTPQDQGGDQNGGDDDTQGGDQGGDGDDNQGGDDSSTASRTSNDEEEEGSDSLTTFLNPGIVAALDGQNADTEGDVLAEEDNAQANNTENGQVLADEDEANDGCAKFLGLCWYWWIPIVGAIVAVGFIIRGMLREDDELPPARRQ